MTYVTTEASSAPLCREMVSFDGTDISWSELGAGFPLIICSPAAVPFWFWEPLLRRLSKKFRVIFVHPRGLWGSRLPADLRAMTVSDHAGDLVTLLSRLGLSSYGVVAHCIGAAPVVAGLDRLSPLPERVVFVSNRFAAGPVTSNLESVILKTRSDERFRLQYAHVAAAYAPPKIRAKLEPQLQDPYELEAHLRAIQSVREYSYEIAWPRSVHALFAMSKSDSDEIRSSTAVFAERLGNTSLGLLDLEGDHFEFQQDPELGEFVVLQAFSSLLQ